jgi:hypothetical protein
MTHKRAAAMEKRAAETEETLEQMQKTVAVNEKTEWESLYQNHHNTHQTDGRTILYTLKKKKMNRE